MRRGRRRAVRRDADCALRRAGQPAAGVALAGAGLGDDAGAARVVSRDGGARRDRADPGSRRARGRTWSAVAAPVAASRAPIGYILSLEGADSLVTLKHLERAYAAGSPRGRAGALRAGRLRAGHERHRRSRPPRTRAARARWSGSASSSTSPISATRACAKRSITSAARCGPATRTAARWCRTTGSSPTTRSARSCSAARVIGAAFDAWMLVPGWVARPRPRRSAPASRSPTVVNHIDHICQIAGNARHCGIGSDLDGAFGREQCPHDVQTIADLSRLPGARVARLQRRRRRGDWVGEFPVGFSARPGTSDRGR